MIIDVGKLSEKGRRVCKNFEFLTYELVEENAVFLEPVHADLAIKKEGERVYIKGSVKTLISFVCSRCLVPFEFPIDSFFDLVYLPEDFEVIDEQLELDSNDINTFFYYNYEINMRDIVLEQLNLTFPLKPLCSKDCQGICPVCGKLIKNGECKCLRDKSDPRLKGLDYFIKR